MRWGFAAVLAMVLVTPVDPATDWRSAPLADWQTIFDGRTLDGWVVKLAHHELGDNYADTFRVVNGVIQVNYDKYSEFGSRFGHLFYNRSSRTTCSRSSTASSASRPRAGRRMRSSTAA